MANPEMKEKKAPPKILNSRPRVRTPTVLQMEAVECGAACLAIILAHHKRIVPLETLRVECGVTRDGSKASNLMRAARRYGLNAKGFKKEPEYLEELNLPFIVFWNFNHFLLVEGFGKDRVYLNDPGTGPRTVTYEEFDDSFTGVVISMEPGPDFQTGGEKPSMVAALRRRLSGSEKGLVFLFLATLFLVVPGLIIPTFNKIFVDEVLINSMHGWLRPLLLGMGISVVLQGVLVFLQQASLRRMEVKLAIKSSTEFFRHVLALPIQFFQQRFAGDIAQRVGLNDRVAGLLSGELATNAVGALLVFFYGLIMIQYDLVLTLVTTAVAGINVALLMSIARKRKDMNIRLMQDQGKLIGSTMSGLQIIESLKAGGTESFFFSQWAGYQSKVLNGLQKMGGTNAFLGLFPPTLQSVNNAVILGLGGYRVMQGHLSMGDLVAFQALMGNFLSPINQLVHLCSSFQEVDGAMKRLDDVLKNPVEERPEPAAVEVTADGLEAVKAAKVPIKLSGKVVLENVTFGYSPLDPPLLKDFNLTINPGERVAFVGPSGCGKSTLAKLVCGLYKPWSGQVLFHDLNRHLIPRHILVNSFAVVDQEIFLFEGTIRENLTLWDLTVPEKNVLNGCKDALIHDTISSRHGGYDGEVLEGGVNFSGGQRQRLEIARALVNNPTILVLDEATSALDPQTEKIIDENLRRRGCTCIIIAHRRSTIRDCDQIIVLEEGKVVQQGTHDSLMKEPGLYADLIKA
jgi:ATP-binding cassette, subfamily C, bacterial